MAELAAIAEIVAKHSEDVSWKANAKYIRDLGAELISRRPPSAKSLTKIASHRGKIVSVLDGNIPADAGTAPPPIVHSVKSPAGPV